MSEQKPTVEPKDDTKTKRLSKGQRLHIRRQKQTARKEAVIVNPKR